MRKARLDDLGRINALFLEMREALLEEAADGAENLKVVCDGRVLQRKGHGVSLPRCADRVRYSSRKLLKLQSGEKGNARTVDVVAW